MGVLKKGKIGDMNWLVTFHLTASFLRRKRVIANTTTYTPTDWSISGWVMQQIVIISLQPRWPGMRNGSMLILREHV